MATTGGGVKGLTELAEQVASPLNRLGSIDRDSELS